MEYTAVYSDNRQGPIFDGTSAENTNLLGVVIVEGTPVTNSNNDKLPIASMCLTKHGDIITLWHDKDAKVVGVIADTEQQLRDEYTKWVAESQLAPCCLLYTENSDTGAVASVRHFSNRIEARTAMLNHYSKHCEIVGCVSVDPTDDSYDEETNSAVIHGDNITIHDGIDTYKWEILPITEIS